MGRYNSAWNGLLKWNYWAELFSFRFGHFCEFIFGSLHFLKFTCSWLVATMDDCDIMTIVGLPQ